MPHSPVSSHITVIEIDGTVQSCAIYCWEVIMYFQICDAFIKKEFIIYMILILNMRVRRVVVKISNILHRILGKHV